MSPSGSVPLSVPVTVVVESPSVRAPAAGAAKLVSATPLIVKDKSVSILGLGLIGMEIAQILQNFGFTVFGWSRTVKPQLNFKNYSGINGLITVVSKADYVISVLPETNETKNLLSSSILRKFKPGSVLINVGRGSVINEEGLIKVLSEGILGGATLDVFQQEPLPKEHPFWTHPKIVITPHVSGWNVEDAIETMRLVEEIYKADPLWKRKYYS